MRDAPRGPGGRRGRRALHGTVQAIAALTLTAVVVVGLLGLLRLAANTPAHDVVATRQETDLVATSDDDLTAHDSGSRDGYAVWEHNRDGTPVGWDPCRPIELVVNPGSIPSGGRQDLEEAVARLRQETGLDLVVAGESDEVASRDRRPYQPERYGERWAPVLVAWVSPDDHGPGLRTTDRGLALPIAVGPAGDRTYVSAQVVLNADRDDLEPGFVDRSSSWGATLLHELMHVLGLAHVDDPDALMSSAPGAGPIVFGPGDRAGLRALGAERPCRPPRPPGPVTVTPPRT